MECGHSGRIGRTAAIEEVAFDYAFALKFLENFKDLFKNNFYF